MIDEYMQAALRRATFEQIEDGTYIGTIPDLAGIWANGPTLEAAQAELPEVLEGWIILGLRLGHELPVLDGIDLTPKLVAA